MARQPYQKCWFIRENKINKNINCDTFSFHTSNFIPSDDFLNTDSAGTRINAAFPIYVWTRSYNECFYIKASNWTKNGHNMAVHWPVTDHFLTSYGTVYDQIYPIKSLIYQEKRIENYSNLKSIRMHLYTNLKTGPKRRLFEPSSTTIRHPAGNRSVFGHTMAIHRPLRGSIWPELPVKKPDKSAFLTGYKSWLFRNILLRKRWNFGHIRLPFTNYGVYSFLLLRNQSLINSIIGKASA